MRRAGDPDILAVGQQPEITRALGNVFVDHTRHELVVLAVRAFEFDPIRQTQHEREARLDVGFRRDVIIDGADAGGQVEARKRLPRVLQIGHSLQRFLIPIQDRERVVANEVIRHVRACHLKAKPDLVFLRHLPLVVQAKRHIADLVVFERAKGV